VRFGHGNVGHGQGVVSERLNTSKGFSKGDNLEGLEEFGGLLLATLDVE